KAQHDVMLAFAAYRRLYDPSARLHFVGGGAVPRYLRALHELATRLGLGDAVQFAGSVSHAALAAHYAAADVFVCLSEHEGFCIPLLEAMHHDLPVVAFAAAAVPGTMGDGGLVLGDKTPPVVAAAVDRVMRDDALRDRLTTAGRARLAAFSLDRTTAAFEAGIRAWVDGDRP
ncbi:MAG TPA: glycosyltransferase, partial [Acidimicrobiia bacterium]|nr:glycosyltransferase [Acidimicrobiia bacterium]